MKRVVKKIKPTGKEFNGKPGYAVDFESDSMGYLVNLEDAWEVGDEVDIVRFTEREGRNNSKYGTIDEFELVRAELPQSDTPKRDTPSKGTVDIANTSAGLALTNAARLFSINSQDTDVVSKTTSAAKTFKEWLDNNS